ncbi:unnamed protein product [Closterium sp. NIES-53]
MCRNTSCTGTPSAEKTATAGKSSDNRCGGSRFNCTNPSAKVEAVEAGACGGKGGGTAEVGACGGRPPGEQERAAQVEARAAVGGATVAAGGSCKCLADFCHRLPLPPTVAHAAVKERGGGVAAGSTESLSPPPHTPPFPPQRQALEGERVEERGLLLDFHATPLPFSLPLPPPPHSNKCCKERKEERRAAGGGFLVTPVTPSPSPPMQAGAARREMGRSGARLWQRLHVRLLRARVGCCCALAAAARALAAARAFATAAVCTAVRTDAACAGDCYARRRARCCSARVCMLLCARLLCDGARDGLRTAGAFATVDGAFATVDGAFATGKTRDEGMTKVCWNPFTWLSPIFPRVDTPSRTWFCIGTNPAFTDFPGNWASVPCGPPVGFGTWASVPRGAPIGFSTWASVPRGALVGFGTWASVPRGAPIGFGTWASVPCGGPVGLMVANMLGARGRACVETRRGEKSIGAR